MCILTWLNNGSSIILTHSPVFPSCHASPPSWCRRGCTWSCTAGRTHYPCRLHGDLGCPPVWWSAVNAGPPADTLWGCPALTWCQDTRPHHRLRYLSQVCGRRGGNKRGERKQRVQVERKRGGWKWKGRERKKRQLKRGELKINSPSVQNLFMLMNSYSHEDIFYNSMYPLNILLNYKYSIYCLFM